MDLGKALIFMAFLLWLHWYLDQQPAGEYLKHFQFALLQEALKHGSRETADFEVGGEHLPLVIDLSRLHPDKTQRTPPEQLDLIITELEDARPSAIGIDLDFAEQPNTIRGEDYHYLAKWKQYKNIRVGLYGRAMNRREAWLGLPEFAELAAGIALPREDPEHAFSYTRRLYTAPTASLPTTQALDECKGGSDEINCKEDLVQLPVALWLLSETDENEKQTLEQLRRRSQEQSHDKSLALGEYVVDYSYLRELRKEIITLSTPNELRLQKERVHNRTIIIGDLHDASDQFCDTPHQTPLPGVLIHACAVATLNRGLLWEISAPLSRNLKIGMTVVLLLGILGVRLFHTRSRLYEWDYQYLEILAFGSLAFITYYVCKWQIRRFGVYWPDFLWVTGALMIHPFLTEPFCRAALAFPKVFKETVLTFVSRDVGRTHED